VDCATLGLVGARGYVGQELCKIIARHPRLSLAFVESRTHAGRPVAEHLEGAPRGLRFEDLGPEGVAARGADAVVLALPNGHSASYVAALDRARPDTVIVDISADHRCDEAWEYGLPELHTPPARPPNRRLLRRARRIANPGCYATAAALAVAPVAVYLASPAQAFGVSGYSGAGATPSPRNDVEALRDNLVPYALVGHAHEHELACHVHLVRLLPHVAPFFRGIAMTVTLPLREPMSIAALSALYERVYAGEPLIRITPEVPLVRDAANRPHVTIGGFASDAVAPHAVVVCTLDNLLKGAASQAVQNLNLALGFPELTGIEPWPT
jgi:N-acetyl-gamma-glutamyl-phosphate reductase